MKKYLKSPWLFVTIIIFLVLTFIILITTGKIVFTSEGGIDYSYARTPNVLRNNPITSSTTCVFKKSFNNFLEPAKNGTGKVIHFVYGNDDQTNTSTFVNLDTNNPIIESNTGQSQGTQIVYNDSDQIILTTGKGMDIGIYKILKNDGVVTYIDVHRMLYDAGTLQMGYCN